MFNVNNLSIGEMQKLVSDPETSQEILAAVFEKELRDFYANPVQSMELVDKIKRHPNASMDIKNCSWGEKHRYIPYACRVAAENDSLQSFFTLLLFEYNEPDISFVLLDSDIRKKCLKDKNLHQFLIECRLNSFQLGVSAEVLLDEIEELVDVDNYALKNKLYCLISTTNMNDQSIERVSTDFMRGIKSQQKQKADLDDRESIIAERLAISTKNTEVFLFLYELGCEFDCLQNIKLCQLVAHRYYTKKPFIESAAYNVAVFNARLLNIPVVYNAVSRFLNLSAASGEDAELHDFRISHRRWPTYTLNQMSYECMKELKSHMRWFDLKSKVRQYKKIFRCSKRLRGKERIKALDKFLYYQDGNHYFYTEKLPY